MDWDDIFKFESIGTFWTIEISGAKNAPEILSKIHQEIYKFSSIFSRFDNTSLVFKSAYTGKSIKIPENYLPLIKIYKKMYKLTNGLFTPLIGSLLKETGYDENYSLAPGKINEIPKLEEVLEFSNTEIKFKKPWLLDFGAAGKGFLVDLISKILEEEKIKKYCIDGGGDILYKADKFLEIGLENPDDVTEIIGTAKIKNNSICGSAGNRRKWRKYHHIFNPDKLDSVKDILAVWAIAENALEADALSTALFLVDPGKLSAEFKFEYLIIYPDLTFKKSSNFPGDLYIA